MPRDANGIYSLPLPQVAAGTTITTLWGNTTTLDLASAMSDSLSRSGSGGMLAPLRLFDGTLVSPGMAFVNDVNLGMYRSADNVMNVVADGTELVRFSLDKQIEVFRNGVWSPIGGLVWEFPVADFTATSSIAYMFTAGAAITQVTLPPTPAEGDTASFADLGDTWDGTVNVDGNGETIEGLANLDLEIAGSLLDMVYTGTEWEIIGLINGVYRGAVPPAAPQVVVRWWDTNVGRTYIYFDDGDSVQWVEEDPPAVRIDETVLIGEVKNWPVSTIPAKYLICQGQAVSRVDYTELFGVLGVDYGDGDGATTFNLPDYRGLFLRGTDDGAGDDPDAGGRTDRGDGVTGDAVGTKQADMFDSHGHNSSSGVLKNTVNSSPGSGFGGMAAQSANTSSASGSANVGGNETRPKNIYINYIIYAGA